MCHSHTLTHLVQVFTRFYYGHHQEKSYVLNLPKKRFLSGKILKDMQGIFRTGTFCSWGSGNKNEFLFNMSVLQSGLKYLQIAAKILFQ